MAITTPRSLVSVASHRDYADAQSAVDYLSDRRFPVEQLSIVGSDLRIVEQVTGRRGYGQAIGGGALSGMFIGALLGWFFGLFSLVNPVVSALVLGLWGIVIGAVLGALLGALGHAMTRGRRDFSSVGGMSAQRYDVMAEPERADEAVRLLGERDTDHSR